MPQTYTIPSGLEDSPWEQYRRDQGIIEINDENRAGVMAGFELWKQQRQTQGLYEEMSDFGSERFQQFRGLMGQLTPSVGTNALIGAGQAAGGNYAASALQANTRVDELNKERNDFLNSSVGKFALASQAQAGGLLGQMSGNAQFMAQLAEQQRQFDESEPDFWDSLVNVGGTLLGTGAGFLVGGPAGAAVGGGLASGALGSGGGNNQMKPGQSYGNNQYPYQYGR